jgi:hypothetical protein
MQDYPHTEDMHIHSLDGELRPAVILKKLGDNDYHVVFEGTHCHALYNPFVNHFYVDNKYGLIEQPPDHASYIEHVSGYLADVADRWFAASSPYEYTCHKAEIREGLMDRDSRQSLLSNLNDMVLELDAKEDPLDTVMRNAGHKLSACIGHFDKYLDEIEREHVIEDGMER